MAIIICYLIDLSNVVTSIKRIVWKWLFKNKPFQNYELKPLDCSLCMVHHILLVYLFIVGEFSIFTYCFVCLLSFQSANITNLLICLNDLITKITNKIFN